MWFRASPDNLILLDVGTAVEVEPLIAGVEGFLRDNMSKLTGLPEFENADTSRCTRFGLEVGPPAQVLYDGVPHGLTVRWEETSPPEFHTIEKILITGQAVIDVDEISLTHRRLGEVMYAFGESVISGRPVLFLITEDEHAGKASLRFRGAVEPGSPSGRMSTE
jgi:hypothetical protein